MGLTASCAAKGETMPSTSIQKLYEHGQRAQQALRNLRAREKQATNDLMLRAGTAGAVILAGVAGGGVDGKWGHDGSPASEHYGIAQIGPIPINLGGGLILAAAGMTGALPGSEYITAFGAGLIGFSLGKTVENKVVERAAK